MTAIRHRLRLATETLRFLALDSATCVASKGNPCYSRFCSAGDPCGSQVGCK